MLQVSFSVAPPPARDPSEFAQDIFLLWPGELVGTDGADGADPALRRQVETAGFKVLVHGRVPFSARDRLQMGTGAGAAGRRDLGQRLLRHLRAAGGARPGREARDLRPHPVEARAGEPRLDPPPRARGQGRHHPAAGELARGDVLGPAQHHHAELRRRRLLLAVSALLRQPRSRHPARRRLLPPHDQLRGGEPPQDRRGGPVHRAPPDERDAGEHGHVLDPPHRRGRHRAAGAEGAVRLLPGPAALAAHPPLRAAPGPGQSHRADRRQPAAQAHPDPARPGARRARGGHRAGPRRGAVAGGAGAHPARGDAPTRTCSGWWAARPRRSSACPRARSAR